MKHICDTGKNFPEDDIYLQKEKRKPISLGEFKKTLLDRLPDTQTYKIVILSPEEYEILTRLYGEGLKNLKNNIDEDVLNGGITRKI